MAARTIIILLVSGLALGCSDSDPADPAPDSGGDTSPVPDSPGAQDAPADTQLLDSVGGDVQGDLLPDTTGVDGPLTNKCTAKTADGIALNPGCDPDFKAKGPTAIGQFTDFGSSKSVWIFTCGKKFWIFNPLTAGGGSFIAGGKDIATTLKKFQPGCTSKSADGVFVNPGCDLTIQANGPTALGKVKDVNTKKESWLFTAGKKFWIFDPTAAAGKGAFIAAGADIAKASTPYSPGCAAKAADGTLLNPGCDTTFKANGPTAWGEFIIPASKKAAWMFVSGTKYWILDVNALAGQGAFVAAGKNLADALINLSPACAAKAADGTPLNPACDADFKAIGATAVGEMTPAGGKPSWLFTVQKKFWLYNVTTSAFVAAGKDISVAMRKLSP